MAEARVPYRLQGDRQGAFRDTVVLRCHVLDEVLERVVASCRVRLGIPLPTEDAQLANEVRGALRVRRRLRDRRKGAFLTDERLDLFLSSVGMFLNQCVMLD